MITSDQKKFFFDFLKSQQERLVSGLKALDSSVEESLKTWELPSKEGGGTMRILRGSFVEKSGVGASQVEGSAYPGDEPQYKGRPFWVAGLSTITHMYNPHAPTGHMNVRIFYLPATKTAPPALWTGGGGDLTPFLSPWSEDVETFHGAMETACEKASPGSYSLWKEAADKYFYIPHRKKIRGAGGVFYDWVEGSFEELFFLAKEVSSAYVESYLKILEQSKDRAFNQEEKKEQLKARGHYAEFNLMYDRGTKFGIQSGGFPDIIFASLPPMVAW